MEFVDYKCLESLLIEGEEIAQEGILKTASKVVGGTIDYKENRMIPAMESLNPFLYYTIFISPYGLVYMVNQTLCGWSGAAAEKPFNTNLVKTIGFDSRRFGGIFL